MTSIVMAAPLMGIVLELFLPLPSSLIASALVAVLGSAFTSFLWVAFKYDGHKSFKFFILNLKNFIYTPNMLKIFGSDGKKKATSTWFGFIALSTAIQIFLFTPGNASFVENTVSNKIKKESGVKLAVECPGTKIYFYQEPIECRVKTGIFGISVPARVTISPIIGTFTIKVSLL
ncbi:MAG: hypothetical protein NTW43_03635 [Actinobacteria bacterium]|nr:hypothetical protein [Actinomycetota bacterium]